MAQDQKREAILTPPGRVSYPHVFEKAEYDDGKSGYEITLIFPAGTDLTPLKKLAAAALKKKWPDELPKNLRLPFIAAGDKYGDIGFSDDDTYVKFKTNRRPVVIGSKKKNGKTVEITEEDFYPGCWARVSCDGAYAYDAKGNRGVAFSLSNVQKLKDDEPFGGGRRNPDDEFDELEIEDDVDSFEDLDDDLLS
jgi:hypothetical protein